MREYGYYWCKNKNGFWFILEWKVGNNWSTTNGFYSEPIEINETRIKNPDEDCEHDWQNTDVDRCFVCSKCGEGMNES